MVRRLEAVRTTMRGSPIETGPRGKLDRRPRLRERAKVSTDVLKSARAWKE